MTYSPSQIQEIRSLVSSQSADTQRALMSIVQNMTMDDAVSLLSASQPIDPSLSESASESTVLSLLALNAILRLAPSFPKPTLQEPHQLALLQPNALELLSAQYPLIHHLFLLSTFSASTVNPILIRKVPAVISALLKRVHDSSMLICATIHSLYSHPSRSSKLIAIASARALWEDVFAFDDSLAPSTKRLLSAELQAVTNSPAVIMSWISDERDPVLRETVIMLANANLSLQSEGWLGTFTNDLGTYLPSLIASNDTPLLHEFLSAISVMIEFAIAKALAHSNVVPMLLSIITSPQVGLEAKLLALDSFEALFTRQLHREDKLILIVPSLVPILVTLNALWALTTLTPPTSISELQHRLLVKIAQIMAEIGSQFYSGKAMTSKEDMVGFDDFLSMFETILHYPSSVVSWTVAGSITDLFRGDICGTQLSLQSRIPALTHLALMMFRKSSLPDDIPVETRYFYRLECLTKSEWEALSHNEWIKWNDALKVISQYYPSPLLKTIADLIVQVIQLYLVQQQQTPPQLQQPSDLLKTIYTTTPSGTRILVDSSPFVVTFRALTTMLEQVIHSISSRKSAQLCESLAPLMQSLLTQKFSFDTINDSFILTRYISLIHSTTSIWANDETLFRPIIGGIVECCGWRGNDPAVNGMRVRSKAFWALKDLIKAQGSKLIDLFDAISARFEQLFSSGAGGYEATAMIEFLVDLIHKSHKPDEWKHAYIQRYLGNTVNQLLTADLTDGMAWTGIRVFEECLPALEGGYVDDAIKAKLQESKQTRVQIENWLGLLDGSFRRCVQSTGRKEASGFFVPRGDVLALVAEQIFLQVGTVIGALFEIADLTKLPPKLHTLLDMSQSEKNVLISRVAVKIPDSDPFTLQQQTMSLQHFLTRIREHSTSLLSCFARLEFFYHLPVESVAHFLDHAHFIQLRNWKAVLSPVKVMLYRCPPSEHNKYLPIIISRVYGLLGPLLIQGWAKVEWGTDLDDAGDDDEISEEVVAENILRSISSAWADLWRGVFSKADTEDERKMEINVALRKGGKTDFGHPELVVYILTNKAMAEPILMALTDMLKFKDSNVCRRALDMFKQVLPHLVESPEICSFLTSNVLQSVLEALHNPWHAEIQRDIMTVVMMIYRLSLPYSTGALETFSLLPNMTPDRLQKFQQDFEDAQVDKVKLTIVANLLQDVKSVSIAEMFKNTATTVGSTASKLGATRLRKGQLSNEALTDPEDDLHTGAWLFD